MSKEPILDTQILTQEQPEALLVEKESKPESHDFQERFEIPRPIEATLELLRKYPQEQQPTNQHTTHSVWPTTHYLIRDENNEPRLYEASLSEASQQASLKTVSNIQDPDLRSMLLDKLALQPVDTISDSVTEILYQHGVVLADATYQEDQSLNALLLDKNGFDVVSVELPETSLPNKSDRDAETTKKTEITPQIWTGRALLLRTTQGLGLYYKEGLDELPEELIQEIIDRIAQLNERGETIEDLISEFGLKAQEDDITDPNQLLDRQAMLEELEQHGQAELSFQPNGSEDQWRTTYQLNGYLVSYEQAPIEEMEWVSDDGDDESPADSDVDDIDDEPLSVTLLPKTVIPSTNDREQYTGWLVAIDWDTESLQDNQSLQIIDEPKTSQLPKNSVEQPHDHAIEIPDTLPLEPIYPVTASSIDNESSALTQEIQNKPTRNTTSIFTEQGSLLQEIWSIEIQPVVSLPAYHEQQILVPENTTAPNTAMAPKLKQSNYEPIFLAPTISQIPQKIRAQQIKTKAANDQLSPIKVELPALIVVPVEPTTTKPPRVPIISPNLKGSGALRLKVKNQIQTQAQTQRSTTTREQSFNNQIENKIETQQIVKQQQAKATSVTKQETSVQRQAQPEQSTRNKDIQRIEAAKEQTTQSNDARRVGTAKQNLVRRAVARTNAVRAVAQGTASLDTVAITNQVVLTRVRKSVRLHSKTHKHQSITAPQGSHETTQSVLGRAFRLMQKRAAIDRVPLQLHLQTDTDAPILQKDIRPLDLVVGEVSKTAQQFPSITIFTGVSASSVVFTSTTTNPVEQASFLTSIQRHVRSLSLDQQLRLHYNLKG